ncbi:hypothetical protein NP233_g3723 [Leucocoprinus birnbaumii]|uniref:DUF7918 domain-containing protein n=1 Tax=Leucocoprinus birnbaumii TaxID=56174 RepID=A0AAD5VZW9_9AGAR|nr:hypothetical protein NP233_g3723 [Leucocoprinus birnbaumii]
MNGMSVTMRVDGVELPEFKVERDVEKSKISCWVPSQVDKEFEVIVNSGTRARGPWAADVVADGARAYNAVFLADQSCNVGFFQKSSTVKCPFSFSKLDLVDDDDLLLSAQTTRIGEIEVSCHTVAISNSYLKPDYTNTFADNSKVHEKSKKGLSEHVRLKSEIESTEQCKFFNARDIELLGTFVFRYRSLDYLQTKGIAPDPSQKATVVERRSAPSRNTAVVATSKNTAESGLDLDIKPPLKPGTGESDDKALQRPQARDGHRKAPSKRKKSLEEGPQAKKMKRES